MVIHAFGKIYASPEEFQQLRQLADAHNAELWEDAAECFGGLDDSCYRGNPCVDLRFFSFGMIKTATAIGGGSSFFETRLLRKRCKDCSIPFTCNNVHRNAYIE
jgi:perosamine synthetase